MLRGQDSHWLEHQSHRPALTVKWSFLCIVSPGGKSCWKPGCTKREKEFLNFQRPLHISFMPNLIGVLLENEACKSSAPHIFLSSFFAAKYKMHSCCVSFRHRTSSSLTVRARRLSVVSGSPVSVSIFCLLALTALKEISQTPLNFIHSFRILNILFAFSFIFIKAIFFCS